jgi:hypothetical protein
MARVTVKRRRRILYGAGMMALAGISYVFAFIIAQPSALTIASLNSLAVFRVEVFTAAFLVSYFLGFLTYTTVNTGSPPARVKFWLVSFESSKTIQDVLNDFETDIDAIRDRVDDSEANAALIRESLKEHEGWLTEFQTVLERLPELVREKMLAEQGDEMMKEVLSVQKDMQARVIALSEEHNQ